MDEQKQRATRIEEVAPGIWLYSDGSKRNEKGQTVELPARMAQHAITSDTAHDMLRLREEKRRRLYALGAQRAVQDVQLVQEFGEDAHLVERAMTLQQIATTPDAGKAAVMADTALQRAQGYDTKPASSDDVPMQIAQGVAAAVLDLWRDVMSAAIPDNLHDTDNTVEGETVE